MIDHDYRKNNGRWKMEDGRWKMEDGISSSSSKKKKRKRKTRERVVWEHGLHGRVVVVGITRVSLPVS